MQWYQRLASWIASRDGDREIFRPTENGSELYLERFYIMKTPWFEVVLHCFLLSDNPALHDHPWASCGVILQGGYYEHLLDAQGQEVALWRSPGYVGARRATDFHWVELKPGTGGRVWTLFITGPREKGWGFLENGTYFDHEDYFEKTGTLEVNVEASVYKGWLFPVRES